MLPFVVIFGQNLFGAFYSLLARRLSVKLPHAQLQVSAVLFVITFVMVLPFAFWYGDVYLDDLIRWWPYLLTGGVATALGGASLLLIFRYLDAAMGSLLTSINIVMAVLAAMYVLGERLGLQELLGSLIVLLAVTYVLSVHVNRRERRNWTLGIVIALFSAVFFSVGVLMEKFLLSEMGVSSYLVWGFGVQCFFAVLLGLLFGRRHFKTVFAKRNGVLILTTGFMRSSMAVLFVFSIVMLKSLCLAVVLAGLRPLFVSFLGAWLLGERKFLVRKVIASIVAAVGVAVMFL